MMSSIEECVSAKKSSRAASVGGAEDPHAWRSVDAKSLSNFKVEYMPKDQKKVQRRSELEPGRWKMCNFL